MQKDLSWAYFFFRLAMGFNIFLHGAVRLPKLGAFSGWMQGLYENSILPTEVVGLMAHSIPVAEFTIGLLIVFGLFTRQALLAGGALMCALIFGSCLIEKWDFAGIQMVYALYFFILSYFLEFNRISVDGLRNK